MAVRWVSSESHTAPIGWNGISKKHAANVLRVRPMTFGFGQRAEVKDSQMEGAIELAR